MDTKTGRLKVVSSNRLFTKSQSISPPGTFSLQKGKQTLQWRNLAGTTWTTRSKLTSPGMRQTDFMGLLRRYTEKNTTSLPWHSCRKCKIWIWSQGNIRQIQTEDSLQNVLCFSQVRRKESVKRRDEGTRPPPGIFFAYRGHNRDNWQNLNMVCGSDNSSIWMLIS